MVSAGLTTLSALGYDILNAASGRKQLHVLCIGHGGGSLPLFIANKIQDAIVHSVEIDPFVISASIQSMGFPASSLKETPSSTRIIDNVMWNGVHERLHLSNLDAETFICENKMDIYDLIFVDAYDGDDVFPWKLWDPDGMFLKSLEKCLHPDHGTVVLNLNEHVLQISRAYKHMGMAFAMPVPWLSNVTLVACRSTSGGPLSGDRSRIIDTLMTRSCFVEYVLDLPFSCLHYINKDVTLVS